MLHGDAFLQLLDQRFFELHDQPAILTDQMIVMSIIVSNFVARCAVTKVKLVGHAALGQHLHGAVDSRVSYARLEFPDACEQLFDRRMGFGLEECGNDELALLRRTQAFLGHVVVQVATETLDARVFGSVPHGRR